MQKRNTSVQSQHWCKHKNLVQHLYSRTNTVRKPRKTDFFKYMYLHIDSHEKYEFIYKNIIMNMFLLQHCNYNNNIYWLLTSLLKFCFTYYYYYYLLWHWLFFSMTRNDYLFFHGHSSVLWGKKKWPKE